MPEWVPWVFSGIGVFILGLIAAGVKYLPRRSRARAVVDLPAVNLNLVLAAPAPEPPPPISVDRFIDLDTVVAAVEAAPLLQQSAIVEHYRGLSVKFTGQLISAAKTWEKKVSIILAAANAKRTRGVTFEIDPSKYPGLSLLKSGHELTVVGHVKNVTSDVVWLDDPEISFTLPA